jgi:hypothetical protein
LLVTTARIVIQLLDKHETPTSRWISLGAQAVAFLVLPVLTKREYLRTRRSSTLLLVFWPLYILFYGTWLRTSLATGWFEKHPTELGLSTTVASIGFVLWAIECVGPEHVPGAYHPIGKDVNESPFQIANVYSRWFFHWMDGLMKLGSKRPLEEEDVYVLGPEDQADVLADKLERATEKHPNLWVALGAAFGATYAEAAGLKVIQDLLAFAQPQFLRMFLSYISAYQAATSDPTSTPKGPSTIQGVLITLGMFASAMAQTIVLHQVGLLHYSIRELLLMHYSISTNVTGRE